MDSERHPTSTRTVCRKALKTTWARAAQKEREDERVPLTIEKVSTSLASIGVAILCPH
jgi:hypothetical protein